jgi:N-acetylglucosaminyl-diphospho-decaprenol L-rhamnosyltransferase
MSGVTLSIIIVNWNSTRLTVDCIRSIEATTLELDYEVVVVDNASEVDPWPVLSEACPSAVLIRSDRNLGFAGANNLGAERSRGSCLLFLNPDTLVLGDALRRMLAVFDVRTDVGAGGCRLLNSDMSLPTSCVQSLPTITNQVLAADWFIRRWPTCPLWKTPALVRQDGAGPEVVEAVSGACLMVRKSVFASVGGFCQDYFLYAEEADLCHRVRRAGLQNYYVGDATIIHLGGQSTAQRGTSFQDIMMRQSVYKFLRKYRGRSYANLYRACLFLSALIRMLVLLPVLALPKHSGPHRTAAKPFLKWSGIAFWSIGLRRPSLPVQGKA